MAVGSCRINTPTSLHSKPHSSLSPLSFFPKAGRGTWSSQNIIHKFGSMATKSFVPYLILNKSIATCSACPKTPFPSWGHLIRANTENSKHFVVERHVASISQWSRPATDAYFFRGSVSFLSNCRYYRCCHNCRTSFHSGPWVHADQRCSGSVPWTKHLTRRGCMWPVGRWGRTDPVARRRVPADPGGNQGSPG